MFFKTSFFFHFSTRELLYRLFLFHQPHILSQRVYSVMETFLRMCHKTERPNLHCVTDEPLKKNSTIRQHKQDSLPLDSSCQGCPLSPSLVFMKRGLSLDYHLTSCTHSSYQMLPCDMLCVFPPCYVTQWAAFFLCSLPPRPSTQTYRPCQPSPFN